MTGFSFSGDNDEIRAEVVRRTESVPEYRRLFSSVFPSVRAAGRIAPVEPMLQRLDPLVARLLRLTKHEVRDVVAFVPPVLTFRPRK